MKEKIEAWVARDKNNFLYLYTEEPHKYLKYSEWIIGMESHEGKYIELDETSFPNVKWEDEEPTKVELTINIQGED